jgi:hypothetical protein
MQLELSLDEPKASPNLDLLRGKFKHVGTEYPTCFKSFHDEIFEYGKVRVVFHWQPIHGDYAEVFENGEKVGTIYDLLVISNDELARRIIDSCKTLQGLR